MIRRTSVVLVALTGTLACGGRTPPSPPPPAAASPGPAATAPGVPAATARINGRVRFEGAVPSPQPIEMTPECQKLHPEGAQRVPVTVNDGFLAEAVVYVKSGFAGSVPPPPSQPVILDQTGCLYAPTSVALQVGQPLQVRNGDTVTHNVHVRPNQNPEINATYKQGMERTETFEMEETLMPVGCDIHPWMRSYVSVFAHPFFAISKKDGTFEIPNLPAGEYVIEAVHPRLQPVSGKATLKEGGSFTLNLAMKQ